MYVCPECHDALQEDSCIGCSFRVDWREGVPHFLPQSEVSAQYREIVDFYDRLYAGQAGNTWEEIAKRGSDFDAFVAELVGREPVARYLDIGCGEGRLLAAVTAEEKHGVDLSYRALLLARRTGGVEVCVGFAEQLPYPSDYFDAVSSIGVMTHFIDDEAGTREIHRILRPGGHYVVGVYVKADKLARGLARIRSSLHERKGFSDLAGRAVRRLRAKLRRQPAGNAAKREDEQPVERHYAARQLSDLFTRCGFGCEEMITKLRRPDAPLAGQHFRLYVLRKPVAH